MKRTIYTTVSALALLAAAPALAQSNESTVTQSGDTQTASVTQSGANDVSFVTQENANNTGQALRNAGLVPTIYDQSMNGRRFWRVVVGPAQTAADRDAILRTVRGLGFGDAYVVTR